MSVEAMSLPLMRRPRLRWLLVAAAAVALAVLLPTFLSAPSGPPIRGIAVSVPPNPELSAHEVRAAAAPAVHGGLLAVNLAAVRKRVEALAWVRQAEVRRVWPNVLAITVTLERPVARWGEHALVDDSGRLFSPPPASRYAALPALSGPQGSAARLLGDLIHARAMLAPLGLDIGALEENPRGEIRIALADGTSIELGREDSRAKLARFVTVAAPALGTALARAATVDMRYPNGFAVGWKGEGQHG